MLKNFREFLFEDGVNAHENRLKEASSLYKELVAGAFGKEHENKKINEFINEYGGDHYREYHKNYEEKFPNLDINTIKRNYLTSLYAEYHGKNPGENDEPPTEPPENTENTETNGNRTLGGAGGFKVSGGHPAIIGDYYVPKK